MRLFGVIFFFILLIRIEEAVSNEGYLLFCPCMGRFGNQFEQYLGTLSFAKALNRTLVLPPFLEYHYGENRARIMKFERVFQVEPLRKFHRVITMEDFIEDLAPEIWPKNTREVFCWSARQSLSGNKIGCNAKDGNPFGPFWDSYNVDFKGDNYYGSIGFDTSNPSTINDWKNKYSIEKYPVIAFSSAPASFPVKPEHRKLQAYFEWSKEIKNEAENFVKNHISRPFIGIHLRNNIDWHNACNYVDEKSQFFASAQCVGDRFEFGRPTKEMCLPSTEQILADLQREVKRIGAKAIFVSTDKDAMLTELNGLFNGTVDIRRLNKDDPYLSLAILGLSDHFIANCMSTYSAFVVRQRQFIHSPFKSTSFFAFHKINLVEDLKKEKDEL